MFLQIKKFYSLYKILKNINISYDASLDVYKVSSDSNIINESKQNVAIISSGDTFVVSSNIHLNPPMSIQKQQKILGMNE